MTAHDVLVRCDEVARTFGRGRTAVVAVHSVTCEVRDRQRVAIMGPSGSGKSTLLHLMAGLDLPTRGSVEWPAIGGRNQLRPGPISVIFQGPGLISALDVVENVALPLLLAGSPPADARRAAHDALARLGLESLGAKLPEELSGGQAQRIAVARGLAGSPRLILADEPTGQLDQATGAEVIDVLLEASLQSGAGLVISTHDQAVVDRLDLMWSMRDGRLDGVEVLTCSR